MVFKGRFFSSKKSDSSEGSNSPKTPTNGSPSPRSDKKKVRSEPSHTNTLHKDTEKIRTQQKKKETKPKESQSQSQSQSQFQSPSKTPDSPKLRKEMESKDGPPAAAVMASPLVASSLRLNRIKTRSGPLPQESFYGFRGDRGSALGASNLSRTGGDGCSTSSAQGRSGGKKEARYEAKPAAAQQRSSSGGDNGSNSDSAPTGSRGQSRYQSSSVRSGELQAEMSMKLCLCSQFYLV